jgi:hypothetical protein
MSDCSGQHKFIHSENPESSFDSSSPNMHGFHFNSRFSGSKGILHSSHSTSNWIICVDKLPAKQLTSLPGNVVDFLIGMINGINGKQTLAAIAALNNSL